MHTDTIVLSSSSSDDSLGLTRGVHTRAHTRTYSDVRREPQQIREYAQGRAKVFLGTRTQHVEEQHQVQRLSAARSTTTTRAE